MSILPFRPKLLLSVVTLAAAACGGTADPSAAPESAEQAVESVATVTAPPADPGTQTADSDSTTAMELSVTFLEEWELERRVGVFSTIRGIAVDGGGHVYVVDGGAAGTHRVQVLDSNGDLLRVWGEELDLEAIGIGVDDAGNVYVADTGNHRVQVFSPEGDVLRTLGSYGSGEGQFHSPNGIAVDGAGNVYVADTSNHRIQVFTSGGDLLGTWGSQGSREGQFDAPGSIALDAAGNVYVIDAGNHRVQVFSPEGDFQRTWGSHGSEAGQFDAPGGLAVDGAGTVYVTDSGNHRVQVFDSDGLFLGTWGLRGDGEGRFDAPGSIALDAAGNVYVVDTGNHRVQVCRVEIRPARSPMSPAPTSPRPVPTVTRVEDSDSTAEMGLTVTFLTEWWSYGSGEGQLSKPIPGLGIVHIRGIAVDGGGNVYVVDGGTAGTHRMQVFDSSGQLLTTWDQFSQFVWEAVGIGVDDAGNVYVADTGVYAETPTGRMQVFSPHGDFLSTLDSSEFGIAVDGEGNLYLSEAEGQFDVPPDTSPSVAVAKEGTIYYADTRNHRVQVFSPEGDLLGVWGSHGSGEAQFERPFAVAVAEEGTVYVADSGNHRVQVFSPEGDFLGMWGSQGDGEGQFNQFQPAGALAVDRAGDVYVAGNQRVQVFRVEIEPAP